ncbi:hypothetical protein D7M11_00070 [Paenibacillus ginsengarvi]|uniref:Uncharacterized protein n=1 Tax=Paenibacillus ginsengarvi TaxID=400777 RepID=A0A3B0CRK4_9BACL|nr:hypothetical protein D7M11_00070 [Paenibacillus ginsengarvi]
MKQIRVDQMGSNSGVFVGNNNASFWGSFAKTQTGQQISNGTSTRNRYYFSDRDVVDIIAIGPAVIGKRSVARKQTASPSREQLSVPGKARPLLRQKRKRRKRGSAYKI